MESSQHHPLSELIQLDEFTVDAMEQDEQGRIYNSKGKKAVIAVELREKHQVKRV